MRKLIFPAALGALTLAAAPAHAVLQVAADVNGVTFFCADNTACDLNPAVGILQVADGSLNGVTVNGSIQASGQRSLNTSSLSVINTTGLSRTVTVAVSDTGFPGGASTLELAGAGTWQDAIGGTVDLKWFDDTANHQGAATAFDTPGALVDSFTDTATLAVDGFSTNASKAFPNADPFSLTEQAAFTLPGGGELINRGQGIIATPEPSTWAMVLIGALAMVGLGRRVRPPRALA